MEINKKQTLFADIALFVVAIIWGTGFVMTKKALSHFQPISLNAIRFWIGFFIMTVICIKKFKDITLKDIKGGAIVGFFLYIAFLAQTVGIQYTSVGNSAFLTGTNVVMVPFIYWMLFKEKPDKFSIVAAIICFIGIAMLTLNGKITSIGIGDGLTLLCALFFACHIISTGFYVKKIDMTILTMLQFGVVAVLSSITALLYENLPSNIAGDGWVAVFYLGIFSTCIAFFLQTVGQKYTYSTHAAIILSMESVFGTLFSAIFLKEVISFRMILGCIMILFAIITAETRWEFLYKKKKENIDVKIKE